MSSSRLITYDSQGRSGLVSDDRPLKVQLDTTPIYSFSFSSDEVDFVVALDPFLIVDALTEAGSSVANNYTGNVIQGTSPNRVLLANRTVFVYPSMTGGQPVSRVIAIQNGSTNPGQAVSGTEFDVPSDWDSASGARKWVHTYTRVLTIDRTLYEPTELIFFVQGGAPDSSGSISPGNYVGFVWIGAGPSPTDNSTRWVCVPCHANNTMDYGQMRAPDSAVVNLPGIRPNVLIQSSIHPVPFPPIAPYGNPPSYHYYICPGFANQATTNCSNPFMTVTVRCSRK